MDSEELRMENEETLSRKGASSGLRSTLTAEESCPACGTQPARETARYCLVCGKVLSEDYQPLDTYRSAHRLQGKSFLVENGEKEEIEDLFARSENNIAQIAWACFVYSMVPYIGILFVPFTFVIGVFGLVTYYRYPKLGGRRLVMLSMGMSFVVLAIQVFLWWLLYLIPKMVGPV